MSMGLAVAVALGIYLTMSVVGLIAYGVDKSLAAAGMNRVAERTLHLVELFGGWPGAWVGRRVFRHKTRKKDFVAVSRLIVAVHLLAWVGVGAAWLWR